MQTEQTDAAVSILKQNGVQELDCEGETIRIYDDIPTKVIAKWLFDGGILVSLLMRYEKTLENYYMELLGR